MWKKGGSKGWRGVRGDGYIWPVKRRKQGKAKGSRVNESELARTVGKIAGRKGRRDETRRGPVESDKAEDRERFRVGQVSRTGQRRGSDGPGKERALIKGGHISACFLSLQLYHSRVHTGRLVYVDAMVRDLLTLSQRL